jgi:hypothetical protein
MNVRMPSIGNFFPITFDYKHSKSALSFFFFFNMRACGSPPFLWEIKRPFLYKEEPKVLPVQEKLRFSL